MKKVWKRIVQVYCKTCSKWIDENTVTILDISEDIQGKDILTFDCPECHTKQDSKRIS